MRFINDDPKNYNHPQFIKKTIIKKDNPNNSNKTIVKLESKTDICNFRRYIKLVSADKICKIPCFKSCIFLSGKLIIAYLTFG